MTDPVDEWWLGLVYWLALVAGIGLAMFSIEQFGRYVLGLVAWCWSIVG